jgi:hypothetical protein
MPSIRSQTADGQGANVAGPADRHLHLVLVRSLLPPVNYDEKQIKRPTFHVTKTSMTRFEYRP